MVYFISLLIVPFIASEMLCIMYSYDKIECTYGAAPVSAVILSLPTWKSSDVRPRRPQIISPQLSLDHTDHSLSPNDRFITSQKFCSKQQTSFYYIKYAELSLKAISKFGITDWVLSVTHCLSYTIHLNSWFWCGNCTGGAQCNHHRTMLSVGSHQT